MATAPPEPRHPRDPLPRPRPQSARTLTTKTPRRRAGGGRPAHGLPHGRVRRPRLAERRRALKQIEGTHITTPRRLWYPLPLLISAARYTCSASTTRASWCGNVKSDGSAATPAPQLVREALGRPDAQTQPRPAFIERVVEECRKPSLSTRFPSGREAEDGLHLCDGLFAASPLLCHVVFRSICPRRRFAYSSTAAASQLFGDGARPCNMNIDFVEGRRRREQRGEQRGGAACVTQRYFFCAQRWRQAYGVLMTLRDQCLRYRSMRRRCTVLHAASCKMACNGASSGKSVQLLMI